MDQYPDFAASSSLLRTLRVLQDARNGAPITDMDALACTARLRFSQLPRLIATGILAGWIVEAEDGALGCLCDALVQCLLPALIRTQSGIFD